MVAARNRQLMINKGSQSRDHREQFFSRRGFLAATAILTGCAPASRPPSPAGRSAVSILRAASYSSELADLLLRGAAACGLDVRGQRILLKPNLVEFDSSTAVNTHAAIVA